MYIGNSISDTPVIAGIAASAITSGAFKAVKFDSEGKIVLAGAGENAMGFLLADAPEAIAAGDDVTIQIKDIALVKTGAAIAAGAEVSSDANGVAKTSAVGEYILGYAITSASDAGETIRVQIAKCGQKPALTLSALSDVAIVTPTAGQALKYDATATKWKNDTDAIA